MFKINRRFKNFEANKGELGTMKYSGFNPKQYGH